MKKLTINCKLGETIIFFANFKVDVIGIKRVKRIASWQDMAELKLMDNTKSVTISKSVYSYDILTLTVELGSALGLWLGMDMLSKLKKTQMRTWKPLT